VVNTATKNNTLNSVSQSLPETESKEKEFDNRITLEGAHQD